MITLQCQRFSTSLCHLLFTTSLILESEVHGLRSFFWPGLSRDVGLWARSCLRCQRSKIQTHVKTSVLAILVPSRRFSHVHIDIIGPLPSSQGYSYLLTMIDRTTCWPEAVPLSSISTEACVRAFIATWVSRFRVPSTLTSDRGAQFTSSI